jgi:uncharacterized membrane protein
LEDFEMVNKKKNALQNKKSSTKAGAHMGWRLQESPDTCKAAKRRSASKGRTLLLVTVAFLMVIAGLPSFFVTGSGKTLFLATAQAAKNDPVTQVSYPVSRFDNGKARFYKYKDGKITIKYFILKSSDGVIRAAFDACDVCWKRGKGYKQKGDYMVCVNCKRKFASVLVNEVKGGCNPAPLTRAIVGDQVVIKVSDILEGKGFFDFSKVKKRKKKWW